MNKKTVLIRLDKIGDLVATLPVDEAPFLHASDPQYDIQWIVDDGVRFLCDLAEPRRQTQSLSLKTPWTSFKKLLHELKNQNPEVVVIFYAPWWVSLAVWLAKIPVRAGRLSQWHSFLFLNRGLRQSRSTSDRHESQYNWELLHFAFAQTAKNVEAPVLSIKAPQHRNILEKLQISAKDYFVVHPGMAGSALNWPQSRYNELIEKLIEHTTVVITGTAADAPWLTEIQPRWKNHPRVRWAQSQLNIEQLIYILQSAKSVIAPSTGILHLAASTGTPTVGIYSPIKAHHPKRWGPRSRNRGLGSDSPVKILLPAVNCPATIACLKDQCPHHPCMSSIRVEQVLEGLHLS